MRTKFSSKINSKNQPNKLTRKYTIKLNKIKCKSIKIQWKMLNRKKKKNKMNKKIQKIKKKI